LPNRDQFGRRILILELGSEWLSLKSRASNIMSVLIIHLPTHL
jgi:hypothetical protein